MSQPDGRPDHPRPQPLSARHAESRLIHERLVALMRAEACTKEERAAIRRLLTFYDGAWKRDRSAVLMYSMGVVYVWCPALFPAGGAPGLKLGAARFARVLQAVGKKERMA